MYQKTKKFVWFYCKFALLLWSGINPQCFWGMPEYKVREKQFYLRFSLFYNENLESKNGNNTIVKIVDLEFSLKFILTKTLYLLNHRLWKVEDLWHIWRSLLTLWTYGLSLPLRKTVCYWIFTCGHSLNPYLWTFL